MWPPYVFPYRIYLVHNNSRTVGNYNVISKIMRIIEIQFVNYLLFI